MSTQYTTPTPSPLPASLAVPRPEPTPVEKLSIICSKGSLDMAYPGLILANAARMSGIDTTLFFTFWGLDIVNKEKVDKLHVSTVGNPSMPIPTMLGGLPGMESLATLMMKKEIQKLDLPTIHELVQDLKDAGAHLYACKMAMDMFQLQKDDLVPEIDGVLSAFDFFEKSAGAQIIFI